MVNGRGGGSVSARDKVVVMEDGRRKCWALPSPPPSHSAFHLLLHTRKDGDARWC
jgi:hypothetical protein